MNLPPTLDERLVAAILRHQESHQPDTSVAHLEPETLARFAAAELPDGERTACIEHLAHCSECRETVALLLLTAEPGDVTRASNGWWSIAAHAWPVFALAASLLVAVGIWYRMSELAGDAVTIAAVESHLRAGEFAEVDRLIEQAKRNGIDSPQLTSLAVQSARHIPDPLALAYSGRLSDFGVDLGGIMARDPQPSTGSAATRRMLEQSAAVAEPRELLLNRGHWELSQQRYVEAQRNFEQVLATHADDPLALLGRGLAEYLSENYADAETTFARVTQLAPENLAARWNRAMCLEELGRLPEALAVWRELLPRLKTPAERERLEKYLRSLGQ